MGTGHLERLLASGSLPGADPYVTGDLPTIRYLTGFSGSNATVVISADGCTLITDGRYREQAAEECPGIAVHIERDVVVALATQVAGRHINLDDRTSLGLAARLTSAGFTVQSVPDPVAALRRAKDAGELRLLHEAGSITARALAREAECICVGDREVDIARRLEARFGELGADDRAFPTIVASGANSAIPHHRASQRALQAGDLLVIDCGAMVGGYHADMTRTFVVGAEPHDWQRDIHAVVAAAQERGRNVLAAGVPAREIDAAARTVIESAGYGSAFTHGTGHGVGLQIHEPPMLSATSEEIIEGGFVVTVEPGVYLPGRGGVRIEDTVAVADQPQVLTPMDRALTRVG